MELGRINLSFGRRKYGFGRRTTAQSANKKPAYTQSGACRRSPHLKLKLSGMEGLTPVGFQSAVRSRRSLRRGSSRSAHGKQPRSGTQRLEWRSPHLSEIELRLLEIPQEAIVAHESKNASRSTLFSRNISDQSAPHLELYLAISN